MLCNFDHILKRHCLYVHTACPQNVTITTKLNGIYFVGDTVNCTSTGGYPQTSYQWLNGPSGQTYTLLTPGTFQLTRMTNVSSCQVNQTVTLLVNGKHQMSYTRRYTIFRIPRCHMWWMNAKFVSLLNLTGTDSQSRN